MKYIYISLHGSLSLRCVYHSGISHKQSGRIPSRDLSEQIKCRTLTPLFTDSINIDYVDPQVYAEIYKQGKTESDVED